MTKLIDCPICGETKPVRDDAKVCSSNCRVKAWRERKAEERIRKHWQDLIIIIDPLTPATTTKED